MRLIVVGCEYTGKSTLVDGLYKWGEAKGFHFHLDDHFSIPDYFHVSATDRDAMVALPPTLKERFQRFQIHYHIGVLSRHDDVLFAGFHLEEMVYGQRYYYPAITPPPYWPIEHEFPDDTILLLLTASPDAIRERMARSPHPYSLVKPDEVETVSAQFRTYYNQSILHRRLEIDTSTLAPAELISTFLKRVIPLLDTRDLLRWQIAGAI